MIRINTGKKLGIIAAAIFVLHLLFFKFHPVVSFDGCNYLRWFDSAHWRGSFAPFYPLVVQIVHIFCPDLVLAGQIVSALAGSLLVFPLYHLTRKFIEDDRIALVCTGFVVLNPLIFRYGLVTMSDSLSLFLLVSAFYCFYEKKYFWTGIFLGFNYLTRPETLLFALIIIVILLWSKQYAAVGKLASILVLIMIPYIIFMKIDFGVWTISGKLMNVRVWDDVHYLANETKSQVSVQDVTQSIVASYPLRFWRHFENFYTYGGSFLIFLGIYGMFKKPRVVYSLMVLLFILPLFGLITADRFIMPCIVAVTISIFAVMQHFGKTWFVIYCLVLAVSLGTTYEKVITPDEPVLPLREVGLAMKERTKPNERFYDRKPYIAFYAGGEYWEIPNIPLENILQSAQTDGIKYLVVDASNIMIYRPQLAELLIKDTLYVSGNRYVKVFRPPNIVLRIFERQELIIPETSG